MITAPQTDALTHIENKTDKCRTTERQKEPPDKSGVKKSTIIAGAGIFEIRYPAFYNLILYAGFTENAA